MKKRTKKRNAFLTRQRLLAVAEEMFAKRGYEGTSMRDIAEKANIRAATMYHYFPSKKAILTHVFKDFYERLARLYTEISEELPLDARFSAAFEYFTKKHFRFLSRHTNFAFLFFLEGIRPGTPLFKDLGKLTRTAREALRRFASRFKDVQLETALGLFMGAVGMNTFFHTARNYLKKLVNVDINEENHAKLLSHLVKKGG
jgi:AcrR family transcriptional regulator